MPPPNKKQKVGQQNTLKARAAKSGRVYGQEGFAVKFSKTDMKSVPGLKAYARRLVGKARKVLQRVSLGRL